MKLQDAHSPLRAIIEPLEQRIAPALLVNGANLLGAGNPTTGQASIGGNSVTLVQVLSGDAIVWYSHGDIAAISVGPNTSLVITGDVGLHTANGFIPGPIIGNLTASGHLSDSDNNPANGLDGDVLLPNNILGITTHPLNPELGSIGEIITGGSVSNVNISGNLSGVYAGTGAFYTGNANPLLDSHVLFGNQVIAGPGAAVDVNPILPGIQNSFFFSASNAKTVESGASITNVKINGAADALQVFAGNGAAGTAGSLGHPGTPGLPGGSISNITIASAYVDTTQFPTSSPSYFLLAGSGGTGAKGGSGGNVANVNEVSSSGAVDIIGGQGGIGLSGPGGVGGSISVLNMESDSTAYTVHAGKGGDGTPGGAGGSVKSVNFGGDQLANGIVVAARFTGGPNDDLLLVDGQTGTMIIEENNLNINPNNPPGFTPVVQDSVVNLTTIAAEGATPVAAVAVNLINTISSNHPSTLPDIVVAYKNTDNLGVYINQGGGVFYLQDFTNNVYTGDTLEASSVNLPYAPTTLAAGNFLSNTNSDLAVTLNNQGQTEFMTLAGDGDGNISVPSQMVMLPAPAISLLAADISNGSFSDLWVGLATGEIDALISTGGTAGTPFNDVNSGVIVGGGIANLDYNPQLGLLLALNTSGTDFYTYVSNTAGALTQFSDNSLTALPGTALVAHFVPETQTPSEPIEVLSSVGSGSRLDVYNIQNDEFTLTTSISSPEALKNFTPVIEGAVSGVAAVGDSVEHFAFSQNGGSFTDILLPFNGKTVSIIAGDGGNGVGAIAKGGAGGVISGMSILAGQITLTGGTGGSSQGAAAGSGGGIFDVPVITVGGHTVSTILEADSKLIIDAGSGGSSSGVSHSATGGSGGVVQGLDLSMLAGDISIATGNGGNGSGGAAGSGGTATALKAIDYGGSLDVTAGAGGNALGAIDNGGAGGSIFNLTHSLSLTNQGVEDAYGVTLLAGAGGTSAFAVGGAGGTIGNVNLSLETPNESVTDVNATPATTHADVDSTVRVILTAGNGGNGASGGIGGAIKDLVSTSIFDQTVVVTGQTADETRTFRQINPVAAQLTSGTGGNGSGTKGTGGAGGAIDALTLVGISHYDPDSSDPQAGGIPLVIVSGNGGNGVTAGGAGGAILGVSSMNAQFTETTSGGTGSTGQMLNLSGTQLSGATVTSGTGGNATTGNGGAGGAIASLSIGVSGTGQDEALSTIGTVIISGGQMSIQSGGGGNGGTAGKGGAGGTISSSLLGTTDAFSEYGLLLQGGGGGNGALGGGVGANVTNIQLNAPENAEQVLGLSNTFSGYDALSALVLAGNGGNATGSGVGGAGGSISQIVESKDVNTAINLLQAGNGGSAVGTGGAGGSVSSVFTVGLIGQASDDFGYSFGVFQINAVPMVFNSLFPFGLVPQGVFAGRGGTGATAGVAGSVSSVTAADIAAIGAAMDSNGLFAPASKVSNITAGLIAYDQIGNGLYDNESGTNLNPPSLDVPIDGFIFSATTPTGINVTDPALLQAFTFIG